MIFMLLLRRHMNFWMATRLTALAMTDLRLLVKPAMVGGEE